MVSAEDHDACRWLPFIIGPVQGHREPWPGTGSGWDARRWPRRWITWLPAGQMCYFRTRRLVKDVYTEWSVPIQFKVI